ncbi:GNAT family N-acetyltransferase [Weissella kandleri]|uniref:GNAT family N-acetyltransferase n=1 Tax=Weissella kandleri TaxID=1616 RepID=UPI00387E766F
MSNNENKIMIQPIESNMQETVATLLHAAFSKTKHGYDGEAELVDALRKSTGQKVELVALDIERTVVGEAFLTQSQVADQVGYVLAPLAVTPTLQKQGIGGCLIEQAEVWTIQNDGAYISILGDPNYYGRFGYEQASQFGVLAPAEIPDEYFLMKKLNGDIQLEGTLKYAPEFGIN